MLTKIFKIEDVSRDRAAIEAAGRIIRDGGLVGFPTETVYGLGADALNETAAQKIYEAKGRPSDNPLIIHIAGYASLFDLAENIPEKAGILADRFWPGPLTMIFKKRARVPLETTGGLETVAVRMPDHPVALALIEASGRCIAAPSGNLSGKPSPTRAEHMIHDMSGRIDAILDGGPADIGIESTILDMTCDPPVILRPGYITEEMMLPLIGSVARDRYLTGHPQENGHPKAPGMKYRHYAPEGEFVMFSGEAENVAGAIVRAAKEKAAKGFKTGVITTKEHLPLYRQLEDCGVEVAVIGDSASPETIARNLYALLRHFDRNRTEYIFGETVPESGFGDAVMNRLNKAAGYRVIRV